MRLSDLVGVSQAVAASRRRLDKRDALATLIERAGGDERPLLLHYLAGVLPQGKVGIGPALIRSVAATAPAATATLTLADVDSTVAAIGAMAGAGAKARREAALVALLARATPAEQAFLTRLLLGELRQGALDGVLIEALAVVTTLPAAALRRAAMLAGDLPAAGCAALVDGAAGLARFRLEVGRPLAPMLAQPAESLDDAVGREAQVYIEAKLDGARVQIHRDGEQVRVFTRQLNDITAGVPELVETAKSWPLASVIVDGEAIALRADGRPHPFQTTMRRIGRRRPDATTRARLPLSLFVFDCLFIDGNELIDLPLRTRLERASAIPAAQSVPRVLAETLAAAQSFTDAMLAAGHEGVMVKLPESLYAAGSRGGDWRKVKPVQTLDLVVLAAEWGSGRRRGWLSNLHLGCRADDGDGFVMLGKTFKGLTDATLRWQTSELLAREVSREAHVVHVRPELVVEIAFSDVQTSPHYPGGVALRFARVRRYRDDKSPAEIDTLATVRALQNEHDD